MIRCLLLCVSLWWAGAASAHQSSEAYLSFRVDGANVEQRLDIALRDLDRDLALDANGDGNLSWGEVRSRWADIEHLADAGVRFTVDAYVNFARRAPWQEAVCSTLTELFAPEIHRQRLATWPAHYPWIEEGGLSYFRQRVSQARRDVDQGLAITLGHFSTRALQERALQVLQFKLDILWTMNDALATRYGVSS